MRLQGMNATQFRVAVSESQLGKQLGNTMSVNVLERLFTRVLPAARLVRHGDLTDRWADGTAMRVLAGTCGQGFCKLDLKGNKILLASEKGGKKTNWTRGGRTNPSCLSLAKQAPSAAMTPERSRKACPVSSRPSPAKQAPSAAMTPERNRKACPVSAGFSPVKQAPSVLMTLLETGRATNPASSCLSPVKKAPSAATTPERRKKLNFASSCLSPVKQAYKRDAPPTATTPFAKRRLINGSGQILRGDRSLEEVQTFCGDPIEEVILITQ